MRGVFEAIMVHGTYVDGENFDESITSYLNTCLALEHPQFKCLLLRPNVFRDVFFGS